MFDSPRDPDLWAAKDCGSGQPLLGCGQCLDRPLCGGLHVPNLSGSALDCMAMCCGNKEGCDFVCPAAPARYLARLQEVGGLDLNDIPLAPPCPVPDLPSLIPLVQGNLTGSRLPRTMSLAAVPLSMAVKSTGQLTRAKTPKEMREAFGATPPRGWVVSGVEKDSRIERLWRIDAPEKLYASLKKAGVVFATTPNFSMYINAPRHDNLHSMKRIALTWFEMMSAGLPAALHINGRTDRDFERWGEFARKQVNLQAVAFEFLTGAESTQDGSRYVRRLKLFAETVGRKNLVLVLRGGTQWVNDLREYFAQVISIDSDSYFKTVKRQRAVFNGSSRPAYLTQRTSTAAEVRALYAHNWEAKLAVHMGAPGLSPQRELDLSQVSSPSQEQGNHESPQFGLFTDDPLGPSA